MTLAIEQPVETQDLIPESLPRSDELKFYVGALSLFVVLTSVWLAVWATLPALILDWRPMAITSESMEPTIRRGDVVVAKPHSGEGLGGGTVIAFRDQGGTGELTTHRIWLVLDDGRYVTRGDGNAQTDPRPISPQDVEAVGRVLVPLIGLPRVWLWQSPPLFVVWLTVMVFAVYATRWAYLEPAEWEALKESLRVGRHRAAEVSIAYLILIGPVGKHRRNRFGLARALRTFGLLSFVASIGVLAMATLSPSSAAITASTSSNGAWWQAAASFDHDAAVTDVIAPAQAGMGDIVEFSTTISNLGVGSVVTSVVMEAGGVVTTIPLLLQPGASDSITIPWDLTALSEGIYTLRVSTITEGDIEPSNNEMSITVEVVSPVLDIAAHNAEGPDFEVGVPGTIAVSASNLGNVSAAGVITVSADGVTIAEIPAVILAGQLFLVDVEWTPPRSGLLDLDVLAAFESDANAGNDLSSTQFNVSEATVVGVVPGDTAAIAVSPTDLEPTLTTVDAIDG